MNKRPEIGRGLFYTRDSTGHSDLSPPQYVAWARREAEKIGVTFEGTPEAITAMIKRNLSELGDVYLDFGISGNHLSRPGLDAFRRRALSDRSISHVFAPRRDRIARPDDPVDGYKIEKELRQAGLTVIFMNEVLRPSSRGDRVDVAEIITSIIAYDSSGKFRRELAEKLIHAKIKLAERGFSIGGEPPYGFRRWLTGPDGTAKRELEDGEIVKMSGHHVTWLPTSDRELRVVQRILDLIESTPVTRIARILNGEGIPSPKAGRFRLVRRVAVANSGLWNANTVKAIATHPLLVACWEYGRRAMGDQLRLTPTGPRPLVDGDYRPDGRPRAVVNPADGVIRTAAGFDPVITDERHDSIVQVLEERGRHLKGKSRTRGDSPNPLGGRIYDLNCGWLMYRHERRGRWEYLCGLYQNSQAKCCSHNVVPGDATTGFVLACLRQRALTPTALAKLRSRLEELAAAEIGGGPARSRREACRAELSEVELKLEKVGRNMALAETPEESRAMAPTLKQLRADSVRLRKQLDDLEASAPTGRDPGREVEAAMAVLDRLGDLADSQGNDYASIGELFRRIDARLYLRFRVERRDNRMVNVPGGGVLTFGSTPPPGPLYDGPTDRTILRARLASGESVAASPTGIPPGSQSPDPGVSWSAKRLSGIVFSS